MLWATVALIMAYIITAVIETSKPLKSVNEVLDAAGFNGTRRVCVCRISGVNITRRILGIHI